MSYKLFLQFDQLPKSLNKKLRSNRFKNHNENLTWDLMVEHQVQNKKPIEPLIKAHVSILRHSHRTLDYDGLVGSMKPVVDALVSARIIADDSWNVLGRWDVSQKFRPKKDGDLLEIIIQEMPEPTCPGK